MSKPIIELHPKYEPLITSPARYSVVSGGRGSSKSFSVATYLVLKTFEKGNVILFSRYTMVSAHLSVIPEFLDKIETMDIEHLFHITTNEIINKVTGSRILFRGIKSGSKLQTANLKSIEGLNIWVLDEAEELVDPEIFDTIDLSVRIEGIENKVILVFNPPTKTHWLYKRWFKDMGVQPGSNLTKGRVNYIHTTYLDNLDNLDETFIEIMEELKLTDPSKYDNIVMGGFKDSAEGLIFTDWEVGKFPEEEAWECGLDFGYSNSPNALTRVYIDDKRKLVYLDELMYEGSLKPSLMADKVTRLANGRLIVADSASPDLIAEIKGFGGRIEPVKKPKILDRIEMMQDYKFIVSPRSNNIVEELNNYCWDPHYDEGDKPITEFDHCFVGGTLISTSQGQKRIDKIEVGDLVHTSAGLRKVLKRFDNGVKPVNKYRITTQDGVVEIESTDNHVIKTNLGWIQIKQLREGMKVYLNPNILKEKSITFTKERGTIQEVIEGYIELFGNTSTERFQKDTIYTTLMVTLGTMIYQILIWLGEAYTLNTKEERMLLKIQNIFKDFKDWEGRQLKNGTQARKEESGTVNNLYKDGKTGVIDSLSVSAVEKLMKVDTQGKINTVQESVKQKLEGIQELIMKLGSVQYAIETLKSISIEKQQLVQGSVVKSLEVTSAAKQEVYDIMVEDKHEYYANNMLVHNSLDGIGYYIVFRKRRPKISKFRIR